MQLQKTIAKEVTFEGKGLHSGKLIRVSLLPNAEDKGVVFFRRDKNIEIPVDIAFVNDVDKEIVLSKDGVCIKMVEHILAAITGLEIDNIRIELDADELPIGDGSALFFVEQLKKAGIVTQNKPKNIFHIRQSVWVMDENNDKYIVCLPNNDGNLRISYTIYFPKYKITTQYLSLEINQENFIKEIAPARTFGFFEEVKQNLENLKGGSLDNAVIIKENKILNKDLRFEDELVRHKILDLLGDLSLLGVKLKANIIALRSGHELNIKMVKKLASQIPSVMAENEKINDNIETTEFDIEEIEKILPHRYPFLLVDRIVKIEKNKRIIGIKNVTINEPFFVGHFPKRRIMPGVLILEAMAQVGGLLVLSQVPEKGEFLYFTGMDKVRFRRPVVPGDQLVIEVISKRIKEKAGIMEAKAYVQNNLVAEAIFMFAVVK